MKVIIDGEEVECNESVTIIHEDQIIGKAWAGDATAYDTLEEIEEMAGQVHIKCTSEGIIVDVVDVEGEVATSMWQTVDDLTEMTQ